MCSTSAHPLEGNTPIGGAHRRPLDLPDLQTQGPIVWGSESVAVEPMAEVLAPGAEARSSRVPVWAPICGTARVSSWSIRMPVQGSASQLEGEQNIHSQSVGSELHAVPSTPQNSSSSFSPFPSDTLARENPPGRGRRLQMARH